MCCHTVFAILGGMLAFGTLMDGICYGWRNCHRFAIEVAIGVKQRLWVLLPVAVAMVLILLVGLWQWLVMGF